jgi:carbon storage regulator
MLILTRNVGEKIRIDGGIVITVLEIGSKRVSIGIEAPRNVVVLRDEVTDLRNKPEKEKR